MTGQERHHLASAVGIDPIRWRENVSTKPKGTRGTFLCCYRRFRDKCAGAGARRIPGLNPRRPRANSRGDARKRREDTSMSDTIPRARRPIPRCFVFPRSGRQSNEWSRKNPPHLCAWWYRGQVHFRKRSTLRILRRAMTPQLKVHVLSALESKAVRIQALHGPLIPINPGKDDLPAGRISCGWNV